MTVRLGMFIGLKKMRGIVTAEAYLCAKLPHEMVKYVLLYEGTLLRSQGRDWCTSIYVSAWQQAFGRRFKLRESLFEKNMGFYISCAQNLRKTPMNVKKSRSVKHRDGLFGLLNKYNMDKEFRKYTCLQSQYFDRKVKLSSHMGHIQYNISSR